MTRARSNVDEIKDQQVAALKAIRASLGTIEDGSEVDEAICTLETFVDLALRVFSKTNPSKLRDEMRTICIKAHMDGTPFLERRL